MNFGNKDNKIKFQTKMAVVLWVDWVLQLARK